MITMVKVSRPPLSLLLFPSPSALRAFLFSAVAASGLRGGKNSNGDNRVTPESTFD